MTSSWCGAEPTSGRLNPSLPNDADPAVPAAICDVADSGSAHTISHGCRACIECRGLTTSAQPCDLQCRLRRQALCRPSWMSCRIRQLGALASASRAQRSTYDRRTWDELNCVSALRSHHDHCGAPADTSATACRAPGSSRPGCPNCPGRTAGCHRGCTPSSPRRTTEAAARSPCRGANDSQSYGCDPLRPDVYGRPLHLPAWSRSECAGHGFTPAMLVFVAVRDRSDQHIEQSVIGIKRTGGR